MRSILFVILISGLVNSHAQMSLDEYRETLDLYCVTCHNETLKTANLMLDKVDLDDPASDPMVWEKVITKLSLKTMPPVGMPRPEENFYPSFAAYLSKSLDKHAESEPNPGNMVIAHRLNRTEYTNVIRDLLGLEIDGAEMLPPDNSGGFDNLGDLLSVSEVLMESYMSAARVIGRLAVGDPAIQADSRQYMIDPRLLQNVRMNEDLPFGSRGGIAIKHHFPLDGEYVLNIRLQRTDNGYIIGINEPRRLDVRVDGKRVRLLTVGGENVGLGYARGGADAVAPDFNQAQYERTADSELQIRFPMKAGTRTVQVAFLEETFAWEGHIPPPSYENWYAARVERESERAWRDPAVSSIMLTGPFDVTGTGETLSREKVFICMPGNSTEESPCASRILANLTRQAYRRPVTADDVAPFMQLYEQGRDEYGSFDAGIQLALEGLLVSTELLFRIERAPRDIEQNEVYALNDIQLASRLSFFLWSSIPDEELLVLAEQGRLSEPSVLERQVRRMLADEKSMALVDDFADQWLLLRNLPQLHKNQDVFPDFDETLREALYQEVKLFVGSIFHEDRPILDLLRADYTYLNERLARHYGIEDVYGNRFRRVTLTDPNHKGLLARAGIMAITSYPNRNSTVIRGKWVLENILAAPPPPPPADVPPLEATKAREGEVLTLREKMEIHPANPACAVCHNQMDPIGFGLQNYNAIGKWQTEEEGKLIDASGRLPNGTEFEGPAQLQQALLRKPDVITSAFTQKLMTYALGRPVAYYDMPAVREIVRNATNEDYRFSSIVLGIVNSLPFKFRR